MSFEIVINSAIGETRFALLEQGQPVEIRLFRDHKPSLVGAIFHGRVISLNKAFQAAFVDIGGGRTGFLPLATLPKRPGKKPKDLTGLLQEGQKIIVQVSVDACGDKSIRLTGRIELVSPTLILHPFREGAFVSSQIRDPARRQHLKELATSLDACGFGFTLRPGVAALDEQAIRKAVSHLARYWKSACENREKKNIPFLMSQGPDNLSQILRNYAGHYLDKIIFDQPATLKLAQDWGLEFAPDLIPRMTLHQERVPLFDYYGIEEELEGLFDHHLPLPCGGWITLEQTEAMIVADVNMGTAVGNDNPAKQRFKINIEATREIFRQIRLRGISGLIVIDYINMSGKADISNLLTVVDNLIQDDPVQIQRTALSAFGILELTRKASHWSLDRQMLSPARPLATVETRALGLLRQAQRNCDTRPGIPVTLRVEAEVKKWFETHASLLDKFTRRTGSKLTIC